MKIQSGNVKFSNGQEGVFISKEDLGSAGSDFRMLLRLSEKLASDLNWKDTDKYRTMLKVMWFLIDGMKTDHKTTFVKVMK